MDTVTASAAAGFTVHPTKSTLEPSQTVTFVGFVINPVLMTVRLTEHKAAKLQQAVQTLLREPRPTIQFVASVVGMRVTSYPGVAFGPLFYRQ